MCTHHTTYFCGTCSACQRDKLARWRRQLADATIVPQASHRERKQAHSGPTHPRQAS